MNILSKEELVKALKNTLETASFEPLSPYGIIEVLLRYLENNS